MTHPKRNSFLLLLFLLGLCGCNSESIDKEKLSETVLSQENEREDMIGESIRKVLDEHKLNQKQVIFVDDPPGKLRGFSFPLSDSTDSLIIYFEYDSSNPLHFSTERSWKLRDFLEEKVVEIKYE